MTTLGQRLTNDRLVQLAEATAVFVAAATVIALARPFVGQNPLLRQAAAWCANIVMLGIVWLGLRARGQTWAHLGLRRGPLSWRAAGGMAWRSLAVLVAGVSAFVLGSIIMANITGIPEPADMSGYNYLRGNLPMLLFALGGVFVVSSLGEEIIYRGFLINRLSEMGAGGRAATRWAVVASAVIFGLAHFEWGPMGMVQTGFMGLAFGMAYLMVRRNLWVLVLAHACMDTTLLVQQYLPAP